MKSHTPKTYTHKPALIYATHLHPYTYTRPRTHLVREVVGHLDGVDFVEVKLNTLDDLELGPSIPDAEHA